jgi:Tfp pilus assembly protein PilV
MNSTTHQSGFSAVELLITLLIGFLFIMMGYQLYGVAIQNGGESRELAQASNLAYEKLRRVQSVGTGAATCPPSTPVTTENVDNNKAVMTTTISCPSTDVTKIRLVSVKVKYNVSQREITHAMYVSEV